MREHIAAATAALNQPGGGKGAVMAEQAKLGNRRVRPKGDQGRSLGVLFLFAAGEGAVGLPRRQNHDHLAALEARFLLDLGDFRGVDLDPV